jgi:signal peptidase I
MRPSPAARIAAAVVLLAVLTLSGWALWPTQLGGHTAYAVVSGSSMEPRIKRGDFVLVRQRSSYAPGDVVLYDNPDIGADVLHRIVSVRDDGYAVKGDANDFVDGVHPTREEVVGELWLVVPGAGSFVSWLQRPLNALAFVLLAVFIALLGGREATRRTRIRPGVPARATGIVAPGLPPAPAPRALRRAAITALALFGVLALVAWTRSPSHQVVEHDAYAHTGSFAYSAAVPRSPVYPDGRITTGETAFVKLVPRLDVSFAYELAAPPGRSASTSGTTRLDATISDGTGWTRRVPLTPVQPFSGTKAVATGVLDLEHLEHVVAQMRELTGSGTSTFTVALAPHVSVTGFAAGAAIEATFAPELPFQLDPTALRLVDPDGADPVLEPREAGTGSSSVATHVGLGPFALATRDARVLSLLGLATALGLLAVAGTLLRGGVGTAEDVAARFGGRIVEAEAVVPAGRWVTDVADIETLVRIAEAYERLVLHAREHGRDVYVVDDGVAVYRFATGGPPAAAARTSVLPAESR